MAFGYATKRVLESATWTVAVAILVYWWIS